MDNAAVVRDTPAQGQLMEIAVQSTDGAEDLMIIVVLDVNRALANVTAIQATVVVVVVMVMKKQSHHQMAPAEEIQGSIVLAVHAVASMDGAVEDQPIVVKVVTAPSVLALSIMYMLWMMIRPDIRSKYHYISRN
jgi:hypothetical protein